MNKENIMNYLSDNDIEDLEVLKSDNDILVLRGYYDFDDDELKAAEAYANDESGEEKGSDVWYDDFFLSYLSDIAVDNTGEIIEEIKEEEESLEVQFITYAVDREENDYCEILFMFYNKDIKMDIDKIMDELEL